MTLEPFFPTSRILILWHGPFQSTWFTSPPFGKNQQFFVRKTRKTPVSTHCVSTSMTDVERENLLQTWNRALFSSGSYKGFSDFKTQTIVTSQLLQIASTMQILWEVYSQSTNEYILGKKRQILNKHCVSAYSKGK